MPRGKHVIPNPYSFSLLKDKLSPLGINWVPSKGKGGHGSFVGPDHIGEEQAYPLPDIKNERGQINSSYFKTLRRRFGLAGSKWDEYFANRKAKLPK